MRTLILFALLVTGMVANAQDGMPDLNRFDFNNTRLWSTNLGTIIGQFDEERVSGIVDIENKNVVGLEKDFTIGNYIFIGSRNDSLAEANDGLGFPSLRYFASYNSFELSAPIRFMNKKISFPTSILRIGSFDGVVASIPIYYTPSNSTSDEKPIGTIAFDNNFLYVRTTDGTWKRIALFDIEF